MNDDFGLEQLEDTTILGLLEKGPRGYKVISVQEHGNGEMDPFCRENIVKRFIRTRGTDQEISHVFGRGGDRAYIVMNTMEPDTETIGEDIWVLGEAIDTDFPKGKEADPREFLNLQVVPATNERLLTDEQVEWILGVELVGLTSRDSFPEEVTGITQVVGKTKNGFENLYFVDQRGFDGEFSEHLVTTKRVKTLFDRDDQGNLVARFRDAEKALETPEFSAAIPQAERRNHHMVSNLPLTRELRRLHRLRKCDPGKLVEYPMTGCSPKGRPASDTDEVGWRDAVYRSAIRQRRGNKDPFGLRQKRGRDLPPGLHFIGGKYMVRIDSLDIDGLRVLAHNNVEKKSRTSKEVYEQLMEALVHKAVRGQVKVHLGIDERVDAWKILARYGEDGLRTGARLFAEFFADPEKSWFYPDDQARQMAAERFSYGELYNKMKTALHRAYNVTTPLEDYVPFWAEKDHEERYGEVLELQEDFIGANFDRTYPSEQYKFRKTLSKLFGAHDKKSYLSKSKALRRVMELTLHVISNPTVNWVYEIDGKGGGEWKLEIDWSTFDYFAEGIEAFRDWVRMISEWQQTKSMKNAFDAMSFTAVTADQGRTRDFGGIWNGVPIWQCWAYRLLYWYANSRPSVLGENGRPQFDAQGNRLWKRRAPLPIKPTRERPKRLPGETQEEWTARITEWEAKYPTSPAKPVRAAGDSDELWFARRQAYNKAKIEWQTKVDIQWAEDIHEYQSAINARVAIMGWAWHDRDPMADMPHDGVLRMLTVIRWADWLDMIKIARGFNSQLGDGLVPDHSTYLKEQSSKVRNYRNETEALESDEGAIYDPQGIWDYLGGIIRDHVMNFLNYRLSGTFEKSDRFMDVLFDGADVYNETATRVRNQLAEMWQGAPIKGIKQRLFKLFDDALSENVIHIRPIYTKFLDGLPVNLVEKLQPLIRGFNRRSDRRIRLWANHLSVGREGGKRVFKAGKYIDEMYGTNTGDSPDVEQEYQDSLGFMDWMNTQYDKALPFVRGLVLRERWELITDSKEVAEHIVKLIEGGLYYEVAWEILEIASHRGLFLKARHWFPSKEEFVGLVKHTGIDEKFNDRCRLHLGSQEFRAVVEGYLFTEMRKGSDPAF